MGGNGSKHILRSCKLYDGESFSPGADKSGFSAQPCHFLVICPAGMAQLLSNGGNDPSASLGYYEFDNSYEVL